ncbi:MAG: zinc transporter ZupT [Planctomycetaceae bacterium]|nr:zinc transporter ZupT [Planctomycetaceae bacterium]
MSPMFWLILNCGFAILAALAGGWLPMVIRFTHRRSQLAVSFVSGLMLGVAIFVLLPHAIEGGVSLDATMIAVMLGLLLMFGMLRAFHFHQHGPMEVGSEETSNVTVPIIGAVSGGSAELPILAAANPRHEHDHSHDHSHDHGCSHDHDASHSQEHGHAHSHELSWLGVGFGLSVHTFLDGVMLAASVQADAAHGSPGWLGLGVFLAIVLHKPLDSMAITSLMAVGGWSFKMRQLVNFGFALMLPLGALVFQLTLGQFSGHQNTVVALALAFSAGALLCIALADLLPEIQFHNHDRVALSVLLLGGVTVAYVAARIEHAGHDHSGHGHTHGAHAGEHDDHPIHATGPSAVRAHDDHLHEGHEHVHKPD